MLDILKSNDKRKIRALFAFDTKTPDKLIRKKFIIWSRYFFPKFFQSADASFHRQIEDGNIGVYLHGDSFLNIGFRGSAKTTRTKLFIAFAIANDKEHFRKYFKVNSKELENARQSVTDVYNMLISRRVKALYPEIFEKTEAKREERMSSFTTATGIKMTSDSIGTDQRGDIQDESRPDFLWFDDFETKLSLMSAPTTFKIWQNMEEARNGLAKGGAIIYTCNYLSERGNVHKLYKRIDNKINIPIKENGEPTWSRYTKEEVAKIEHDTEDFAGEYLGKPEYSKDVYFERGAVERQESKDPIDEVAGLKIFVKYDPSHRIASGHDVGGGVGLDHSTSVFIDFDILPAQVIATYKNNEIKPDVFAHEVSRQGKKFGENYVGVEKNYGSTLDILKTIYPADKIHKTQRNTGKIKFVAPLEYGWETNAQTKPKMLADFAQAIKDGLVSLNDKDLIQETLEYTLGDLLDPEVDPRITTRHFDLLMAACIAWEMQPFVKKPDPEPPWDTWLEKAMSEAKDKNQAR